MPMDIFIQLQKAFSQGLDFIEIEQSRLDKWFYDVEEYKRLSTRIDNCARWNNQGIAFEKAGNTAEAIKAYEQNIADEYTATHAYDRLIKIYRRIKQYVDELRIIQTAIRVFTRSNEKQYEAACKKPDNRDYIGDLQIAHETCTGLNNADGRSIYSPYPLFHYMERIGRCQELLAKQSRN